MTSKLEWITEPDEDTNTWLEASSVLHCCFFMDVRPAERAVMQDSFQEG